MVNIAIFEISPKEARYVQKQLKGHKLSFFEEPIQNCKISDYKDAQIISPFIYSKLDKETLSKCKKLKCIATRSTGFDHVDLDYCKKQKIAVGNVPFYGENTVAEHCFGLILNLSRNIHKSYIRTLQGNFKIKDLQGFDLKGKTLGVIGTGRIGLHVIRIAKGFGMHVKAYDIKKDTFLSEILHFEYSDIDSLLKHSDIISLHMPYMKATHHFIDAKKIAKMKKSAILINTARGGLIDTDALYEALKSKKIAGAGLDVLEGEKEIQLEEELMKTLPQQKVQEVFRDRELLLMENVIFTPHNAFNSSEAVHRILDTSIDNVKSFIDKKEVKFSVIK